VIVVVALNRQRERSTHDPRLWKGAPLYGVLAAGAVILYTVIK
jgi:hypothetical protein